MENYDEPDLAGYLRRRRALAAPPARVRHGHASRRRVPGLRRQELAEAASISVEYYTRLEQGRAPRPSRDVLSSLARALELAPTEREHLFLLARELPPGLSAPSDVIRPGLLRVMEHLGATMPVTVHDGRLDVLAANDAATAMLGPVRGTGRFGRNIVHRAFASDALTSRLDAEGVEHLLRAAAAELRMALTRYPGDAYLKALLDELARSSPDFTEYWERGEVGVWSSAFKRLRHERLGWVTCDTQILHDPERDHWIMLYAVDERGAGGASGGGQVPGRTRPGR